jgi:integrase
VGRFVEVIMRAKRAHAPVRLTKRVVEALPIAKGEYFVLDADLPGFALRVYPSGKKYYAVQYRVGGQLRRKSIGLHGMVTADEARGAARRLLGQRAQGADPIAEAAAAAPKALNVSDLADLYLAEGPADKPNKKTSSWGADRSNLERHIKPLLGRKLASALTQADIAKFQVDVAAGKSRADIKTGKRGRAIVEGGRGTAARSLAVFGAMLQFGVARKLIPTNPAKGVQLLKGAKKERFLSEAELARLADTLGAMEREHRLSATAAASIRLLLLTGCRKSEILALRWEWVDFGRSCLRLPESKTGAKVVPLAAAALELLTALPRAADAAFVLPAGRNGAGHFTGLQKDWERVRARAALPGLRIHDLRHSFASFAVADGHTLFMVGKVLGHRQTRTTEIYAHLADDPLRAVADRTAARIAAVMKAERRT